MNTHKLSLLLTLIAGIIAPKTHAQELNIPLVDLDGKTEMQTTVDKEKGQYLGHPTTLLLEDGKTILAVYPKGHGSGPIIMKRSYDGGKTWSERLPTPENWKLSKEVPTLYETTDDAGKKRILLFSGNQVRFPQKQKNLLAISEDNGKTFTQLNPIPTQIGRSVVMSDLIPLNTGKGHYMATYHLDKKIGKTRTFHLYVCFTKDGGVTWSPPTTIHTSEDDDMHLCEGGFVRKNDTIAILLRENHRRYPSQIMFSADEGRSWTKPRPLPKSLWGDRHQIITLPDGRLLIQFRNTTPRANKNNTISPTEGDWVGWVGTFEDLLHGRDGQYRIRLRDNTTSWDCAYPAIEQLPDGTIVSTTYGSWDTGEPPYILSFRFTINELDAMAKDITENGQAKVINHFGKEVHTYEPEEVRK